MKSDEMTRKLLRISHVLVAVRESFGHYSIDFDKGKRTFTVYLIPNDDAVESEALRSARACQQEIKNAFAGDDSITVTSVENNQKSFSFTIVVEKQDDGKKASCADAIQFRFAAGDDEEGGGDSDGGDDSGKDEGSDDEGNGDDSGDGSDSGSDKDEGSDDGEKDGESEESSEVDAEDAEFLDGVKEAVSDICEKYRWEIEK